MPHGTYYTTPSNNNNAIFRVLSAGSDPPPHQWHIDGLSAEAAALGGINSAWPVLRPATTVRKTPPLKLMTSSMRRKPSATELA
eukprot:scaffold77762_cov48-Phaeocystis_antarctica.AAC.4